MTSNSVNADELVAFAEFLADQARSILREAGAAPTEIQYKADASPVTDLDRRIEAEENHQGVALHAGPIPELSLS